MKRSDGGVRKGRAVARRMCRPVLEERIEDAGHAAGARYDGDGLASARGDAPGPGPEGSAAGGPRHRSESAA